MKMTVSIILPKQEDREIITTMHSPLRKAGDV